MFRLAGFLVVCALLLIPVAAPAAGFDAWTWYDGHRAAADSCIIEFESEVDLLALHQRLRTAERPLRQVSLPQGYPVYADEIADLRGWHGADLFIGVVALNPQNDLQAELDRVASVPGVAAVWPNYIHHTSFKPNDPYYNAHQRNFKQIYMEDAWDLTKGSGATVAVIDTGYRTDGMDDEVVNLLTGYDFWGNDSNVRDYIGHGTHVSNTVAEHTNNGVGCAGIAYQATIMPLKVFPDYDEGALESDIIDAINYANSHGANVINMSLGGGGYVGATNSAITSAVNNDVTVFAASGNDGVGSIDYPGAYSSCIAVGATKQHNVGANPTRASFSNYGSALDIVAPGVDIVQETVSGYGIDYYAYSGTSSASPHAAAVAALLVAYGGADSSQIRQAIENTAHNPAGNWTNTLGYGEIDAYAALVAYGGVSENDPPVADAQASPKSGSAPLMVTFDGSDSYDPDGDIDSYQWKLTDTSAIIGSSEEFTYTFDEAGVYHVQLKVTDNDGKSDTDTVTIDVSIGGDDDDDSDFGDNPCADMTEDIYYLCDFTFHFSNDQIIDAQNVYRMCLEDEETDGWQCLLMCHEKTSSCDNYRKCADEYCGVDVYEDGGDNDDDDDDSGACGS